MLIDSGLLSDYGIDYSKGLINCMGNAAFYREILQMVLDDGSFLRAKKAYSDKDYKELFFCLHELKGVSGNAGLTALNKAIVPCVELLRHNTDTSVAVTEMFEAVEKTYHHTCDGIAIAIKMSSELA